MSTNDNVGKISLSMLKGRSSNQSVPSISFRFNPGSDDLVAVEPTKEEENKEFFSPISENSSDDIYSDTLSSKSPNRVFGVRSSSLDGSSAPSPEGQSAKQPDASSLISRITKTFEEKINEIRNDKLKDQKSKDESHQNSDDNLYSPEFLDDEKSVISKQLDTPKRSNEAKENPDVSTPLKIKSSLVQDFTEQTNKLKSDFNKTIRPKISELRKRKSSKDCGSGTPKVKSSIFQSILGKDDVLSTEAVFNECHAVDRAVEAQEEENDVEEFYESTPVNTTTAHIPVSPTSATSDMANFNVNGHSTENIKEYIKNSINEFLLETLVKKRTLATKCIACVFLICFILPLPRFIAGIIFGFVIAGIAFMFLFQLITPMTEDSEFVCNIAQKYEEKLECTELFEGFMNELNVEYFPESYHVSQTHTVLLRLKGSNLRVDTSRKKINKHARPNEDLKYGGFSYAREFDLSGSEVVLIPKNLPRRWLWSRKYPIVIRLVTKTKKSPSGDSLHSFSIDSPSTQHQQQTSVQESPVESEKLFKDMELSLDEDPMSSSLDLTSYEEVTEDMCEQSTLVLFARTDREKDDWFRRFVSASQNKPEDPPEFSSSSPFVSPSTPEVETLAVPFENVSQESPETKSEGEGERPETNTEKKWTFDNYMAWLLRDKPDETDEVRWFNCFLGRIMFDFLRDQFWANKIQERVQKKLSKLHIPYFVGDIVVSNVDLGDCFPQLLSVGKPSADNRGLWVDLRVAYEGSFRMTLETKLDLMKLKSKTTDYSPRGAVSSPPSPGDAHPDLMSVNKGRVYARSPSSDCVLRNVQYDTDTDDSLESSSEDDFDEFDPGDRGGGGPASKRFLRIVDTVAASRYFQQASEWRVLQKAMQGVSRTRIELGVEVRRLTGTLALNIPPAPSDRLWYGFRGSPEFVMVAKPCLGDHQLNTLPFLAEFIQKHLKIAFEKVFVLPNMDDLVIPIMSPLLPGQSPFIRPPWDYTQSDVSASASPSKGKIPFSSSQSFQKLSRTVEEL